MLNPDYYNSTSQKFDLAKPGAVSWQSPSNIALEQEDFDLLISLTHPDVINIAGGLEYAKQDLMRDAQEYNRMQLRLTSVETKISSKIIEAGEELHAIVPYEKLYENEGLKHEESNYYLAASLDGGETWTFLDLRKHDTQSIPLFLSLIHI